MALEATHIKFALDIKEHYQVENLFHYLSGTIYPDSRYITKIDRRLCHNDGVLSSNFAYTDFKKGWAVHYLCDLVQNKAMDLLVPEVLKVEGTDTWGTPWWIHKTAIKNIMDINIFTQFDIQPYLPMLDYVETPHDEPVEQIKKYNKIIQNLYKDKREITIEDIQQMWIDLGIGEEMALKVVEKTKEFMAERNIIEKINDLYKQMLRLSKEFKNNTYAS